MPQFHKLFNDCGCGCDGKVAADKMIISLFSAAIFFAIMNKETFRITNKVIGGTLRGDCPTRLGFLLHVLVFTAVAFATMNIRDQTNINEKMRISLFSGLLFYLIANPQTFKFVASILGRWVADASGCPTAGGILLHTFVFLAVIYLTMNGRKVKKCNCKKSN